MALKAEERKRTYNCSICEKDCLSWGVLVKHNKIHKEREGPKPYVCKECTKSFKKHDHLKSHLLVHSKVKNFECKECGKMLGMPHSLKKHMYLHSEKKNFSCPKCMKTFSGKEGNIDSNCEN